MLWTAPPPAFGCHRVAAIYRPHDRGSADRIRASGHARRINRPDTWLHPTALHQRQILSCQIGAVHSITSGLWRCRGRQSIGRHHLAVEAVENRRQGRAPRPLYHFPASGGRHPTNPVRRDPALDCGCASPANKGSMIGPESGRARPLRGRSAPRHVRNSLGRLVLSPRTARG